MDKPPKTDDLDPADSGGFLKRLLEAMGDIWKMGDRSEKGRTRGPWGGEVRSERAPTSGE